MEQLSLAITVVFPLFFMMALGYYLKVIGLFHEVFLNQLNNLCFKIFLPVVLFCNIYNSDFSTLFDVKLILFSVGSVTVSFLLLLFLIPKIEKEDNNRGVMIQGIFRSNFILFGIPVASSLHGIENTGVCSILIAFVVPFYNLFAIVALSMYSSEKKDISTVWKSILKNPLIIASCLGILFSGLGIVIPPLLMSSISSVGSIATPLSLIALGGGFAFGDLGKYPKKLCISLFGKLFAMPAVFLALAVALGYRNIELTAILAMFASPTAVSSYTMAQSMKVNDVLAGQIVVFGSLCSVVSICFWITLLKSYQLI